ncbi:MAG: aminotransferase class I/II-fold pyridoxal phosphate-dependent enzyme [Treponema sp.]|jgi:histidinol-phosphate/aromatic aminotransferase/cobyric acid decarboxylase-like protein/choline kinase|nr:aminotransferase class I/II-fold pyridoxal phosphate-dependent enzyme [Treponema sp.]
MQAVILAAGMGSRLGKYTRDNTKCMLKVNGRTLIERALDALDAAGIRKCFIVAGYRKDNLINFVGQKHKNIEITYIINEIYDKTNNIYSLYLAKDHLLEDDTLLLESDIIFEDRIIEDLLRHPEPTLAAVARYESWMDGTVVQISGDNVITQFIPRKFFRYDQKESYYKTVNIYKFSRDFLRNSYVPFLDAYSKAMGNNEYYEQVLRVIAALDKSELKAMVLDDHRWYEIDDVQDKDIAETIFCDDPDEKFRLVGRRYGGYWRFPKMLDFCYLVNPYFPTVQMQNEIAACFRDLLTEYPSGLDVINLLAGKMFNIEAPHILAGNGAAELIRALAPFIRGKTGVIYPTFNEYPESLKTEIVPLYPENISYTEDDLAAWSERCHTLLLINPDNPSGNFIPEGGIRRLLGLFKERRKRLVLDESFVDFSGAESGSLLSGKTLAEFPNLVILKSLSKSYGIPGIRLGVLASGDAGLVSEVRGNLPIWNINSFAEYFLQIAGKYTKDYRAACRLIVEERDRFGAELEKTGLFTVYPSRANYFLCRCRNFTARELAVHLLACNIFIKDLSGKKGLDGPSWVRFAVRNRADNETLIEKLGQFAGSAGAS